MVCISITFVHTIINKAFFKAQILAEMRRLIKTVASMDKKMSTMMEYLKEFKQSTSSFEIKKTKYVVSS